MTAADLALIGARRPSGALFFSDFIEVKPDGIERKVSSPSKVAFGNFCIYRVDDVLRRHYLYRPGVGHIYLNGNSNNLSMGTVQLPYSNIYNGGN